MNWFKRLFKSKEETYKPKVRTLYDFFMMFIYARHEQTSMRGYIRELSECGDYNKFPSKKIMRRYFLNLGECNALAWYLLEQYFKGNITIKNDDEPFPKPGAGSNT